ncbi:6-pyruvoyl trahydropterin synthase family protein [Polycladidibacter stylochi]|uniref:6-pyruvoyl trahydropterin synthase family protein n=1 Tax=Polycladidibacter stylochi TaxID=1807766 RepID=UPI00082EE748|nr:6-carboxytetrahydropterin synthase [Pseudovibrio stylochi]
MFHIEVRDHIMIARKLHGDVFGPANMIHGSTLIVDVAVFAKTLGPHGVVADLGKLSEIVRQILLPLNYQLLHELPAFQQQNASVEGISLYLHDQIKSEILGGGLDRLSTELDRLRILVEETPTARGGYEAALHE